MNKRILSDAAGMLPTGLPDSDKPMRMPNSSAAYTVKHGTLRKVVDDTPGLTRHERNQNRKRQRKADLKAIRKMEQGNN